MIELVIVSRLLEYPDAALWQHQQEMFEALASSEKLIQQPSHRRHRRDQQNGAARMIELVIVSRLLEYPDAALWQHQQ
ncbi:hypothetical protein, partial [Corynebacterium diphtheriae]|uniref:hypothetical protein n=1 Tax=Corynebacterium diphtheriae TaxID=1717 RepID=UPI00210C9413